MLAASAAFYAAFILRSDFHFDGRRYFSLIDDSMISMVYARNLADGHGLVWQSGDDVEGYTNFLWTVWMALLHLLPFSEESAGLPVMISGAALLIATMLVVRSICRVVVPERVFAPVAAMALVGFCYPLVFWTLRGMETGLSALLLALAVRLALGLGTEMTNRRLLALGAVLSAAVLTRDDMLVPSLVVIGFLAWSADPSARRRALAITGGAVALTVVAHVAFRLAYYGDALPNTYYLKLSGAPLDARLERGATALTYTTLTSLYVAIALAAVALLSAWHTPRFRALALLGTLVAIECAYSVYVGGDYAEQLQFANRFLVTALPLLMVLTAIGIGDLVARFGTTSARRAGIAVGVALAVAAAVLQGGSWARPEALSITDPVRYDGARVVIALAATLLLAYFAIDNSRIPRRLHALAGAGLFVLAFAAINYGPMRHWAALGTADDVPLERFDVGRAVLVRENSEPSTSVAVIVAGNWGYFSHRPSIDLLGKTESVVSRGPHHTEVLFKPGHTKWDYDHSVGKLRPDLVADLAFPTERDLCNMRAWGYRQIAPRFWMRGDAQGIDVELLAAGLSELDSRPPFAIPDHCDEDA